MASHKRLSIGFMSAELYIFPPNSPDVQSLQICELNIHKMESIPIRKDNVMEARKMVIIFEQEKNGKGVGGKMGNVWKKCEAIQSTWRGSKSIINPATIMYLEGIQ